MLYTNNTLRKLELDGNLLGPRNASELGIVLIINKPLKLLDLQSNQLTVDGQEMYGVYDLVKFLDQNKTL